jgi:hypothetical protein
MSVAVQINILLDGATPAIKARLAAADPHNVATRIVPSLTSHWRDHLSGLGQNKRGYPSTGFWEDAARRTRGVAMGPTAVLSCDKLGVRQRLYGGPIKAINVQNLTIPIAPESYGTRAADWGDQLTLVILADGRKFLALWLGDEQSKEHYEKTLAKYHAEFSVAKKAGKIKARAAEASTQRVQQLSERLAGRGRPKVIMFKQSGAGTQARAEKHADLKFLFRLMPETAPQAPNPDVIPSDLSALAKQKVLEVLS